MSLIRRLKNWYHFVNASIAVLVYRYPAKYLEVIGVTGTDGKTTTSTLTYHMLKEQGIKVGLISTVAAYIGNQEIDTGFHVTSPDPWSLQRLLRRIVNEKYTHLVLECTSHGLDQHRLLGTNIKTSIITNITHEHLDYHKTIEEYLKAKAKILKNNRISILNSDDNSYPELKRLVPKKSLLVRYSLTHRSVSSLSSKDVSSILKSAADRFEESYNHANCLAASAAVAAVNGSASVIPKAIKSFKGIPGRMQEIPNQHGITAIVDFAHTPNALKNALTSAKNRSSGKLIAVFGAAGLRDASKRPLMGKIASEIADEVILTAEDPRTEKIDKISAEIRSGATKNFGHIHQVDDRKQAISFGLSLARKGDTLIVCGKGHEQSMNLDGKHEIPWSDADTLKSLMA